MNLAEARRACGMTQAAAAEYLGVSLRSYKSYENDPDKCGSIKYNYFLQMLSEKSRIDENHGVLRTEDITDICAKIFAGKAVAYCYLFGSYGKGCPTESSDVDLLISTDITGIEFYSLVEELRTALKKKVDLLDTRQLENNPELTDEILKYGVKIYDAQG